MLRLMVMESMGCGKGLVGVLKFLPSIEPWHPLQSFEKSDSRVPVFFLSVCRVLAVVCRSGPPGFVLDTLLF